MDISTLQTFIPWLSYLTPLAVVGALFSVMIRGKSMYPVWLRLWSLFHSKEPADVRWLASAMDERRALLKFRVLFGWVDTHAQAQRMEKWAQGRGVDLGSVCDCGDLFDRRELCLKALPSKVGVFARVIPLYLVVASLVGIGAMTLLTSDAIFSLKSNGRLLAVDGTTVRAFGQERWTALDKAACAGTEDPGHLGGDRAVACDLLLSNRIARHVTDVIRAQHVFGWLALFYAFFIGIPAWRYGGSLRAAFALERELARSRDGEDVTSPRDEDGELPRMALVG